MVVGYVRSYRCHDSSILSLNMHIRLWMISRHKFALSGHYTIGILKDIRRKAFVIVSYEFFGRTVVEVAKDYEVLHNFGGWGYPSSV